MTSGVTFFQVACALLGTILVSGVLAESRGLQGSSDETRSLRPEVIRGLVVIVLFGFVIGELVSLEVLLGQPPTEGKRRIVLGAMAVATTATATLALAPHWVNDEGDARLGRVCATMLAIGVLGFVVDQQVENSVYGGLGRRGLIQECPGASNESVFAGLVVSEPSSAIRRTPGIGRRNRLVTRYGTGCVLGLDGFCIGQPVSDPVTGAPDGRWFVLSDSHTVVSAATVRDLPIDDTGSDPAADKAIGCEGGQDQVPSVRSVRVTRGGEIRAVIGGQTARVPFVGFAVRAGGARDWQRLEPDLKPQDGVRSRLQVANFRRPASVAAVICLAAEVPSRQRDAIAMSALPARTA